MSNNQLIKKGIEIELFGGTPSGEVVPLSSKLKEKLPFLAQEPDQRNFEYITNPIIDYDELQKEIIEPRLIIRQSLQELGNLTLIPGSTIPLQFSKEFFISKPGDTYQEYIRKTYGTSIITSSVHISFGVENTNLFNLLGALRLDMPLLLALSASSCFHDGKVTGYQSYRWHSFPKTPSFVPLFKSHDQFINWTNHNLKTKKMLNVRHHWSSIRPNGPERPDKLNRIEIRVCDFISNPQRILGIVSLIECLIYSYLNYSKWPACLNQPQHKLDELAAFIDEQEESASQNGLSAKIWNWRNDSKETISEIIFNLYTELSPIAKKLGITKHLNQISAILDEGNEATQFLKHYSKSKSIEATIQYFIEQFQKSDLDYSKLLKA